MLISIITLFPKIFDPILSVSILGRAQEEGKVKINIVDLREFGLGRHKTVDDKPYGGGTGMVLRVDVLEAAINSVKTGKGNEAVILLDPKGETYKQNLAEKFTKYDHLILVCGRYEGFDERIRDYVDFEISIGDYVLSGGELPAMIMVESICRLLPGVLSKSEATELESFSESSKGRILEHPHYTRPAEYKKKKVPAELLSGNLAEITKYRIDKAEKLTKKRRPDLY